MKEIDAAQLAPQPQMIPVLQELVLHSFGWTVERDTHNGQTRYFVQLPAVNGLQVTLLFGQEGLDRFISALQAARSNVVLATVA